MAQHRPVAASWGFEAAWKPAAPPPPTPPRTGHFRLRASNKSAGRARGGPSSGLLGRWTPTGGHTSYPPAQASSCISVLCPPPHKAPTLNPMTVPPHKTIGCCWGRLLSPPGQCQNKSGSLAPPRPQGMVSALSIHPCPLFCPVCQPPAQPQPPHSKQVTTPTQTTPPHPPPPCCSTHDPTFTFPNFIFFCPGPKDVVALLQSGQALPPASDITTSFSSVRALAPSAGPFPAPSPGLELPARRGEV